MPLLKYLKAENDKIVVDTVVAAVAFLTALLINSAVQRHRDRQTYESMLTAFARKQNRIKKHLKAASGVFTRTE